uniref:Uncharacterized protein n=1 Tax=Anopheles coluzzii TaxID=1518534 RepID=A0A8W7PI72_ANOCL
MGLAALGKSPDGSGMHLPLRRHNQDSIQPLEYGSSRTFPIRLHRNRVTTVKSGWLRELRETGDRAEAEIRSGLDGLIDGQLKRTMVQAERRDAEEASTRNTGTNNWCLQHPGAGEQPESRLYGANASGIPSKSCVSRKTVCLV